MEITSEEKVYKCACRGCHGGCMFLLTVKDGKLIKAVPDPDGPINHGKACVKGLSIIEQMYHPDRIMYPMKRIGPKGSGKWERISWNEALDTIAQKFTQLKEVYGPECICTLTGTGRHHTKYLNRFTYTLGAVNSVSSGALICLGPRVSATKATTGVFGSVDYFGKTRPGGIIVWGTSPDVSGPDGELQWLIKDAVKEGIPLLTVDPYPSELAKKSKIWLRIRPGTDAALALGILNVIINEELYDHDFVENWCFGFEELKKRVNEYPPSLVSEITEISEKQIIEAAHWIAKTKPLGLEWGPAFEHNINAFQTARAIFMLVALTGNWDIPGGFIPSKQITYVVDSKYDTLSEEAKNKNLHIGQQSRYNEPKSHPFALFESIKTGKPYKTRAMLAMANNTLLSFPDSKYTYECLKELEFFVYADIFMNPTAELADIILPAGLWPEVNCVFGMPEHSETAVLCQQKVVRVGEALSDEEILFELSKRINPEYAKDTFEELLDDITEEIGRRRPEYKDMKFKDLAKLGYLVPERTYYNYKKDDFNTASGKLELYSNRAKEDGADPLPFFIEPPETKISDPELAKEYPLTMINGKRQQEYFISNNRQIKSLRKRAPFPEVCINPETAAKYGIKEGDWVNIENKRGCITQKAVLDSALAKDVIHCQFGWWYPEDESPLHGVFESNVNVLTRITPPYSEFGSYQMRGILCKISKNDNCKIEERYYKWIYD